MNNITGRLEKEIQAEEKMQNKLKNLPKIFTEYYTSMRANRKNRLYVNSWGKKTQKMKRSKGSGRKVAALNYENICKMRFLNLLKLEYP